MVDTGVTSREHTRSLDRITRHGRKFGLVRHSVEISLWEAWSWLCPINLVPSEPFLFRTSPSACYDWAPRNGMRNSQLSGADYARHLIWQKMVTLENDDITRRPPPGRDEVTPHVDAQSASPARSGLLRPFPLKSLTRMQSALRGLASHSQLGTNPRNSYADPCTRGIR